MHFFVQILRFADEQRRESHLLAIYSNIEAESVEDARAEGIRRFMQANPQKDMDLVYGRAAPLGAPRVG